MRKLVLVAVFLIAPVTLVMATELRPEIEPQKQRAADLAPPMQVLAAGKPLEVAGFAAPCVVDFDSDGKKDLLVGQRDLGRMRVYLNSGSNAQPEFTDFEWFTTANQIAGVPTCGRVAFTPQARDFDGDGDTDILTGSGSAGEVFLFRREANGRFAEAEVLCSQDGEVQLHRIQRNGRPSVRRYNVTALPYDWDADGDTDLLLGLSPLCLVMNVGTARQPVFDVGRSLECDGAPIRGGNGSPQMADWDGDGRDDLIAGEKQGIVWYRNVGQKGQPRLESSKLLVPLLRTSPMGDVPVGQPGFHHSVCVADFNDDGQLDLLVGDTFRRVSLSKVEKDPQLPTDYKEGLAILSDRYSQLRRKEIDEATPTALVAQHRAALRAWQDYERLRIAGSQARGSHSQYGGFVWYFQRIAP